MTTPDQISLSINLIRCGEIISWNASVASVGGVRETVHMALAWRLNSFEQCGKRQPAACALRFDERMCVCAYKRVRFGQIGPHPFLFRLDYGIFL